VTGYPLEASELQFFVPPSLANLPTPPTFTIKPATRRERRLSQRLHVEQGLRRHSDIAIRAEMITALEKLWSPDLFSQHEPILRAYWDALDQHNHKISELPFEERLTVTFDHPDQKGVEELIDRIIKAWPPLRSMAADNLAFAQQSPALFACCVVVGWDNVDVPFALDCGSVPYDRIEDVGDWLEELEEKHAGKIEGIGAPGTAFKQLCIHAGAALYLTKEEAKNFGSPSPTTSTQNTSKETGEEATAGSSKGKCSPGTPRT
jgi:hypothetical protein